jgi:hypothetical protein
MPIIKKRYTICNSCGYVRPIELNKKIPFNIYDKCDKCCFINKCSKKINHYIKANQIDFFL